MFGYLPKGERKIIKDFYEENYLYQGSKSINWDNLNTVKKLSNFIKLNRNDPYSKIESIRTKKQVSSNYFLEFADKTLYVCLRDFLELQPILQRIGKGDYHKIILNLSENGGGSVQEMLKLASLLVLEPVKLCLKYKFQERNYDISGNTLLQGKKICLITSQNSASSAEILAFIVFEGNKHSIIGGEKTYGKGEGQVTRINFKYKYRFSLTAYEWKVNGLNCEELQNKYKYLFDDHFQGTSAYIDKFLASI